MYANFIFHKFETIQHLTLHIYLWNDPTLHIKKVIFQNFNMYSIRKRSNTLYRLATLLYSLRKLLLFQPCPLSLFIF